MPPCGIALFNFKHGVMFFYVMAELRGIEPPARALGGHCSIQLSYSSTMNSIRTSLPICNFFSLFKDKLLHSFIFIFQGNHADAPAVHFLHLINVAFVFNHGA